MKRLMTALVLAAVLLLGSGLSLTGCGESEPGTDADGKQKDEALSAPLPEQYRLAKKRYEAMNDAFAEMQRDLYDDEWRVGTIRSEVVPGQGYTLGRGIAGDQSGESYYFTVFRWHEAGEGSDAVLRRAAETWKARGYGIEGERTTRQSSHQVVVVTTSDDLWFRAEIHDGELTLMGDGPVYWGDDDRLTEAIADRRDAENEAGADWGTAGEDAEGHKYRVPGDYRPFPEWNAVPE